MVLLVLHRGVQNVQVVCKIKKCYAQLVSKVSGLLDQHRWHCVQTVSRLSKMGEARFAGGESEKRGQVESENHYAQRVSKSSECL